MQLSTPVVRKRDRSQHLNSHLRHSLATCVANLDTMIKPSKRTLGDLIAGLSTRTRTQNPCTDRSKKIHRTTRRRARKQHDWRRHDSRDCHQSTTAEFLDQELVLRCTGLNLLTDEVLTTQIMKPSSVQSFALWMIHEVRETAQSREVVRALTKMSFDKSSVTSKTATKYSFRSLETTHRPTCFYNH